MTTKTRDRQREKLVKIARHHGNVNAIYQLNGDNVQSFYFITKLDHRFLVERLADYNVNYFLRGENIRLLAIEDGSDIDYTQFGNEYWRSKRNGRIS